ncbi:MAG: hypothetical protein KBD06_00290 [Candidatus Pacebacteria bacterium]|nr:hypothetical protein [Candidatus Paceibacterota bacterium]
MERPERKFVGGLRNLDPKNMLEREASNYQAGELFGLNHDFMNQPLVLSNRIEFYKHGIGEKADNLNLLIDGALKMKTYEDWILQNGITPEKNSAAFADDIQPYIKAVDEIVVEMKRIATELQQELQHDAAADPERFFEALNLRISQLDDIIRSDIGRKVEKFSYEKELTTRPADLEYSKKPALTEAEATERMLARKERAAEILNEGPQSGSFSRIDTDGNVLPVGWEPSDEDRQKLNESSDR